MKSFQKKNNMVEITIGNKDYRINPVSGLRMITAYDDNAPKLLEEIEKAKYAPEQVTKFMDFIVEIIDDVLYKDACKSIFNGQCNYYDLVDLYVYIRDEVRSFNELKVKEYAGV